ncbi:MAG: aminodeoxychorismate/anthranilate synthase component II [Phycisphaerae bacterium]|nr:aminodeoxychorismate/anthranilate synthase component II [Phycisphaerae bacterium]
MVLVIDNYDSFTFNLAQGLAAARGAPGVLVVRNDAVTARRALAMRPLAVVVSPGPCGPAQAGRSVEILRELAGRTPMLGVCLGHQCLGAAFGMAVVRHEPVHGKTSAVHHDGRTIFRGLPSPLRAMRYHSLIVDPATVPAGWDVSAWTDERSAPDHASLVMGLRRDWAGEGRAGSAPLEGVQFHPESFMTEGGPRLLANFVSLARRWHAGRGGGARAGTLGPATGGTR